MGLFKLIEHFFHHIPGKKIFTGPILINAKENNSGMMLKDEYEVRECEVCGEHLIDLTSGKKEVDKKIGYMA